MTIPSDAGGVLLPIARAAIAGELGLPSAEPPAPGWLSEPGATFVTLTSGGRLRGCIGSLEAWRSVGEDVASNALSAAFRDPRFRPVSASEFDRVRVEVSLLTPPEPFEFTDEADAVARLRPGVDGVILTASGLRGTFLPQVWDELPNPADFMAHLKRKAGLPASYWGRDVRLERYTVTKWAEGER